MLSMPIYRTTSDVGIFGLPTLSSWRDYLIQAPRDGPWREDEEERDMEAGEGFFLKCDWTLEYL
jgi:hypothetical protein